MVLFSDSIYIATDTVSDCRVFWNQLPWICVVLGQPDAVDERRLFNPRKS